MRLETLPIVLGILVGVAAVIVMADAIAADASLFGTDRRLRERPGRNRGGQLLLGVGLLGFAAALIGGDRWRFTTYDAVGALVCLAAGVWLNLKYLRGMAFGASGSRVLSPSSGSAADSGDRPPFPTAEPPAEG